MVEIFRSYVVFRSYDKSRRFVFPKWVIMTESVPNWHKTEVKEEEEEEEGDEEEEAEKRKR